MSATDKEPGRYKLVNGVIHVRCGLCTEWHPYSTTHPLTVRRGFGIGYTDPRRKSTYQTQATSVSRIGNPAYKRVMYPKSEKLPEVCTTCYSMYDVNGELRPVPVVVPRTHSRFDPTPRLVKKGVHKR